MRAVYDTETLSTTTKPKRGALMIKKLPVVLIVLLFGLWGSAMAGQTINTFDSNLADTTLQLSVESAPSFMTIADNTSDFVEGAGALDVHASVASLHGWGSFAQLIYRVPDAAEPMDWTVYDTISIWLKVRTAPTHPEYMVFRIHIADQPTPEDAVEEYIYENTTILDATSDWVNLKIPFIERETDGSATPDASGFVRFPDGWGGGTYNDRVLNFDKIVGYNLGMITSGWDPNANLPADSIDVSFDSMTLEGSRSLPVIIFNGMAMPSYISLYPGWSGETVSVEEGAGATPGTNALRWNAGGQWDGPVWTITPPRNLGLRWDTDTLKFKINAPAGIGDLRLRFSDPDEDSSGTADWPFEAHYMLTEGAVGYDGTWKQVEVPLRDFNRFAGYWAGDHNEDGEMDSTKVYQFAMIITSHDLWGATIYLDDIWTGSPDFDVVPPDLPTNLNSYAYSYYNLITWNDVVGESGETYTVFAATHEITDVNAPDVDVVATGVAEGSQNAIHFLYYPQVDHDMTFYYAVSCTDAAGNKGNAAIWSGSMTNTAKGIPTINWGAPAGFAADGDMSEWEGITPFVIKPSTNNVAAGVFDNDDDLTATIYLAMDDANVYIAADVIDNVYNFGAGNWWDQDAVEFFFGLYDWRGPKHVNITRGAEPDYKVYFVETGAVNDFNGATQIYAPGNANFYFEGFNPDYAFETVIPFDSLYFGADEPFTPQRGMRIPMDLYIHDNDGVWDGNLALSPYNTDHAYQTPREWTYTWLGDTTDVAVGISDEPMDGTVREFALGNNYPNPFNPSTTIDFSIPAKGLVNLTIYNLLGQEVARLVDGQMEAGNHSVRWNASTMASGIYLYRLNAEGFTSTRKMLLVK